MVGAVLYKHLLGHILRRITAVQSYQADKEWGSVQSFGTIKIILIIIINIRISIIIININISIIIVKTILIRKILNNYIQHLFSSEISAHAKECLRFASEHANLVLINCTSCLKLTANKK